MDLKKLRQEIRSREVVADGNYVERELPPLWKHQVDGIERARDKDYFGFFYEPGCLASHTKIRTNRNGISRTYTIEELYRRFNNVELPANGNPWKNKSPTYVRSWNGKYVGLNKIKAVIRSGEKEVFELSAGQSGLRVRATADHEILTERGFVMMKDLVPGKDFVAIDDLKRHQKKEEQYKTKHKKAQYLRQKIGRHHPYKRWNKGAKDRKGFWVVDTHRLAYEASINNLSFMDFKARTYKPSKLKFINPKKFHIHHKNHDTFDNRIENLSCMTAKEHLAHHGSYTHFGHGRLDYRIVKSIVPCGVEMTYDISCEAPHHNFAANNVIVHNCGKTRTFIEAWEEKCLPYGRTLKTIILCPPVIIENFKREFETYGRLSRHRVTALTGSMEGRLKKFQQLQNGNFIIITNYEMLYNKPLLEAIRRWEPELIALDECHKNKNPKAKRTKAATQLADLCKYRYGLSGTPILNSQLDLFSQIRILDGGATFGNNFFVFRSRYFYDANAGRKGTHSYFPNWLPRPGINKELQDKIAPFTMHVKKSEALDLPPLLKKVQLVEMGKDQEMAYNSMKKDLIAFLKDRACVADMALVKALRLAQIVSGYIKLDDDTERVFDEVPRLEALSKILEDVTHENKVIVWCVFKRNYEMVGALCNSLGLKTCTLHGETADKQSQIDSFQQDPEYKVMIANPGAGGIGINLTAASYMVYFSRNFSLEQEIQSEARNYRGGSEIHEKITRIDLVSPGTIDEICIKALEMKRQIGDSILDSASIVKLLLEEL